MKQKLLAVAVLSAISAPAFADVTIAGVIAPLINSSRSDTTAAATGALGGTVAGAQGVSSLGFQDASSRFSITSTEDLGNGMTAGAFVQLRGSDGTFPDYNNTGAQGSSGLTAFRYGASIGGGWGTLELGRNFSPYTWTMILNDPNGGAIWYGPFAIMGQAGGQGLYLNGGAGNTAHAFFRTGTGVHYTSPDINGFSGRLSWMTESAKTAAPNSDVTEFGGSIDFKPADMPFYLGAAYQSRRNANGALPMAAALGGAQTGGAGSTDNVFLVGGGVKFGDLKAGFWFESLKYKTDGVTAGLSELKRNAFWIPVSYALPTGNLGASFIMAQDLKGTNVGGTFDGASSGGKTFQRVYAGNGLGGKTSSFVVGLQHSF
ncbi:MAG: porin [Burkholderiales bacterium]|nr:porin [Burkholderiales bacterium]